MALRADLSADKERGPGYGRLRVGGFDPKDEPLEICLQRNQGTTPYLGASGAWQATEAWHAVGAIERAGAELVVRVGPEIVDPVVTQPTTVAYLLTVAAGVSRASGTLKVTRPLLGSGAAHEDEPRPDPAAEEAARLAAARAAEEEAARRRAAVPEPPPPITVYPEPVPVQPRRWGPLLAVFALAVLGLGAGGAWWSCMLPGFGPARCASDEPAPKEPEAEDTLPATEPPAAVAGSSCSGLDAAACLAKAEQALADGKLEPARQLFQEAAGLGSVEANNRVARMYDPETWAKESSPVGEADWETAVYWYEAAAKQNDVAGKSGAGRLLCQNAGTSFERKRALEYLKAAAEAGDEKAKGLIAECEAKVS